MSKLVEFQANIASINVKPEFYPMFVWIFFREYVDSMTFEERNKFFATVGEIKHDMEQANAILSD